MDWGEKRLNRLRVYPSVDDMEEKVIRKEPKSLFEKLGSFFASLVSDLSLNIAGSASPSPLSGVGPRASSNLNIKIIELENRRMTVGAGDVDVKMLSAIHASGLSIN